MVLLKDFLQLPNGSRLTVVHSPDPLDVEQVTSFRMGWVVKREGMGGRPLRKVWVEQPGKAPEQVWRCNKKYCKRCIDTKKAGIDHQPSSPLVRLVLKNPVSPAQPAIFTSAIIDLQGRKSGRLKAHMAMLRIQAFLRLTLKVVRSGWKLWSDKCGPTRLS